MLSILTSTFVFVGSFIIILSLLIFFHELGHYGMARLFKVDVERFSIGFGKPVISHKAKSGTEWVVGRIPLGGYVKFSGDSGAASNPDQDKLDELRTELSQEHGEQAVSNCYHFKPVWQRTLIALAGPVANFILAIVTFSLAAFFFIKAENKAVVAEVFAGSAAEHAGVKPGDHFLRMNGKNVSLYNNLRNYIAVRSGSDIETVVLRDGQEISLIITPNKETREDGIGGKRKTGFLGVRMSSEPEDIVRYDTNPLSALGRGYAQFSETMGMTGTYISRMFVGQENGSAFSGPVGIFTMVGKSSNDIVQAEATTRQKIRALIFNSLMLMGGLSIGLGVANLMPIPALDGGHLLYYGYEALAGRPLSIEKQELGFRIGFAILMTVFVLLLINDTSYVRSIST